MILMVGIITFYSCSKSSNFNSDQGNQFDRVGVESSSLAYQITNNEFSKFGLQNVTYADLLDTIGKWHNDYQDYILDAIVSSKIRLTDTTKLKRFISQKGIKFFQAKGINFNENYNNFQFGKSNFYMPLAKDLNIGDSAKAIYNDLRLLVNNFTIYNDVTKNKLNNLKVRALKLQNPSELILVGGAISVATNSYNYWSINGEKWKNLLRKNNFNSKNNLTEKPCDVNLYKLGGADAVGAVPGASEGVVAGLGGALAGGILGSAVGSSYNLINQVISCEIDWWPF